MKDYQERIQLDRYAAKDPTAEVKVGDLVVVSLERRFELDGELTESREIGVVQELGATYKVALVNREVPEEEWEQLAEVPRHRIEVLKEKSYNDICKRVAHGVIAQEPDNTEFRDRVYKFMSQEMFVPAGRILAGVGHDDYDLTLFNCYVFPPPHDSRQGIAEHWNLLFDTFSRGGGIGWDNSSHRPKGSVVRKVNGRSSGAVSWIEQYSQITGAVEQGGSRRGAALAGLWCWHPDIEEFICAKSLREEFKVDGRVVSRNRDLIKNANVSVLISDTFMQAVKNDEDWNLIFPDIDDPDYDNVWDGDIDNWIEAGKKINVHKTVKARALWNLIIQKAWESGEPGLLFMERARKMSNSYYYSKISCTNPCVTGDTPIHTQQGILTVNELRGQGSEDTTFLAAQDVRNPDAQPHQRAKAFFSTGTKPVYRLQTKEGYYLRCTANHRVMTTNGWMRAKDLKNGDVVHIYNGHNNSFGEEGNADLGYVLGWLVADGGMNEKETKAILDFYDKKKELAQPFATKTLRLVEGTERADRAYGITPTYIEKTDKYTFSSVRLFRLLREYGISAENLRTVPAVVRRGTEEMQRSFLSALFTADGTIYDGGDKGASVRLDSVSSELLEGVQVLLLNLGIASKIYWNRREAGYRKMPDGKGGLKEYWCQAQHTLAVSKYNMVVFREKIDFLLEYKRQALDWYLDERTRGPYKETFTARFKSLVYEGEEEVFDTTVAQTHSYSSGGLISHNCGEIQLPPWAVCNLGHVNLAKFVKKEEEGQQFPESETGAEFASELVNWSLLEEAVHTGVRFLDNIVDLNKYHNQKIREQQKKERRLGLGVLGYGELLVRLGLRYGSEEALKFTDNLFRFIVTESYKASVELAKERGKFPAFEAEKFVKSGFVKTLPEDLLTEIKKYGIRNVTLNTVAPTGSVGTMLDTTTGIEPYFLAKWVARSRIGVADETAGVFEALQKKYGDDIPSYFVTTREIAPEGHVATQSVIQRWIDASISKTINLPNSATVEEVSEAYMMLYDRGCKGGTVYRDGSRDRQVLYYTDDKNEVEEGDDAIPVEVVTDDYKGPNGKDLRPKIDAGLSVTLSQQTPVDRVHGTIRFHPKTGDPYDMFITSGKGDVAADAQAIGRLISVILRWPDGQSIPQSRRLDIIREQLHRIPGRGQFGIGPQATVSMPDGISKIINRYLEGDYVLSALPMGMRQAEEVIESADGDIRDSFIEMMTPAPEPWEEQPQELAAPSNTDNMHLDICPNCKDAGFVDIPGKCPYCLFCGFTQC